MKKEGREMSFPMHTLQKRRTYV